MTTPRRPEVTDLVEVGRGGFGVVYRARQEQFRRDVALKVITASLDARARTRFTQECHALGQLSGHPHIVSVYDAGIDPDGHAFLIMPFHVRGSLGQRLRSGGALDWRGATDIGVRLSGALQTAHQAGILHRDIKPANVLVDEYGAPRLADFGHARFVDADLTRSGDITATPGYAAPEVLQGEPATPLADVYSLAATLMALILGRAPFDGAGDESVAPVLYRVLSQPPPDLRRFGVPDQVAAVLAAAMAKDPGLRPDSALSLGVALQRAQQSLRLPISPLAVAGQPVLLPPAPEASGVVPASARGRVGTVPYARERPPPAAATHQLPVAIRRRRRRAPVLIAAAIVVVLVVAGFFVVRTLNVPTPRQNLVARDLILGPAALPGGGWQLSPDAEGTLSAVFVNEATLLGCLGLPVAQTGDNQGGLDARDSLLSSVYVSGGTAVQTAGVIAASSSAAQDVVEALRAPGFDICRSDVESSVQGLSASEDTIDYQTPTSFSEPQLPELPTVIDASTRRVVVSLSNSGSGNDSYVVDYVFLAAGEAVACAGFFRYGQPIDDSVRDDVVVQLANALTD